MLYYTNIELIISNMPRFYLIGRYMGLFQYFVSIFACILLYMFLNSIWSSSDDSIYEMLILITFISFVMISSIISKMVHYRREVYLLDQIFEKMLSQSNVRAENGGILRKLKCYFETMKLYYEKYISAKTFGIYSKLILHFQEIFEIIIQVRYFCNVFIINKLF